MTNLKNKRKTNNRPSQSNTNAGIHGRQLGILSEIRSVNPLSRLLHKNRWSLKTLQLSLNPRKSQKLKKIQEMMKNVMK